MHVMLVSWYTYCPVRQCNSFVIEKNKRLKKKMNMINEELTNNSQYQSPIIAVRVVQLEQVIASSGKAEVKLSPGGSK